jgi:hypothetical protein
MRQQEFAIDSRFMQWFSALLLSQGGGKGFNYCVKIWFKKERNAGKSL